MGAGSVAPFLVAWGTDTDTASPHVQKALGPAVTVLGASGSGTEHALVHHNVAVGCGRNVPAVSVPAVGGGGDCGNRPGDLRARGSRIVDRNGAVKLSAGSAGGTAAATAGGVTVH